MFRSVFAWTLIAVAGSCNFVGPAFPDRDAPPYLRRHGYDEDVINKVLAMEDVGEEQFRKLAAEESTDVRFLVAQNPHLSKSLHKKLMRDSDDFVRGGAALSPHLTEEQVAVEVSKGKEENHTVLLYIARNPHLSKEILIDLHEKHGMELMWFAFNPECPEELIQKMKATQDEDALYELEVTRAREAFKKERERDQSQKSNQR